MSESQSTWSVEGISIYFDKMTEDQGLSFRVLTKFESK